jgi:three-Cys-motif partner protein
MFRLSKKGSVRMVQVKFGGPHTVQKLVCLEKYLKAYLKVFKNLSWANTIYIDAFAGTGEVPLAASYDELPLDTEGQQFIVGSARRALALQENFKEYIFIEKKRGNAEALRKLQVEYPEKNIKILNTDANSGLKTICSERDWKKCRAVIFLDPFGSQVEWATIQAIAATEAVDLWYLFPAGLSVHRQVRKKDGTVREEHQQALDRILGTNEWRTAFAEEVEAEPDLFASAQRTTRKTVTANSATGFMLDRLKSEFKGGVLDEWLTLGSGNVHMFSLLFAWANPSPNAKKAGDIAKSVMRSGKRGRAK